MQSRCDFQVPLNPRLLFCDKEKGSENPEIVSNLFKDMKTFLRDTFNGAGFETRTGAGLAGNKE